MCEIILDSGSTDYINNHLNLSTVYSHPQILIVSLDKSSSSKVFH